MTLNWGVLLPFNLNGLNERTDKGKPAGELAGENSRMRLVCGGNSELSQTRKLSLEFQSQEKEGAGGNVGNTAVLMLKVMGTLGMSNGS